MTDPEPAVRRRAADLAPGLAAPARPLLTLLGDDDVTVIEASAWALGELGAARCAPVRSPPSSPSRARTTTPSPARLRWPRSAPSATPPAFPPSSPPVVRKPAVRRRAVLALAPFDSPEVDDTLRTAVEDSAIGR